VRVGAPDSSLTGSAGVVALAELVERLGVIGALDAAVGPIKTRARGLTGGQLLVAMAQCQLLDGTFLAALDRQRQDTAGQLLSCVPAVPARTANSLARRFGAAQRAGVETGLAAVLARAVPLLPVARRGALLGQAPTIDLDSTDVEVYGSRKQGVAYNYCGQRAGRPHLATWAQAGVTLAAELLAGNDDVRPRAAGLLRRALAALPEKVRPDPDRPHPQGWRPAVRADAGYFSGELARAAVQAGCDFAIAAKRTTAMWRAYGALSEDEWVDATGMPGAQVAACDHAPAGWPPDSYTIIRRVRVDADTISADVRSRRRRTIAKDQLALALSGQATTVYAVSFVVTNIPTSSHDGSHGGPGEGPGDPGAYEHPTDVERWFRRRTDIEDRIREAKLGAARRHLPSGARDVNAVWMWAALIAGNLSVLLQALTGLDQGPHGRAHGARLRHEVLRVPARVLAHARGLTLRLPPGPQLLPEILSRLRALPTHP